MIHFKTEDGCCCGVSSLGATKSDIKEKVTCLRCIKAMRKVPDCSGLVECGTCFERLPPAFFNKRTSAKSGITASCKRCISEWMRNYTYDKTTVQKADNRLGASRHKLDALLFERELKRDLDSALRVG